MVASRCVKLGMWSPFVTAMGAGRRIVSQYVGLEHREAPMIDKDTQNPRKSALGV
jgi:hypothetical protein